MTRLYRLASVSPDPQPFVAWAQALLSEGLYEEAEEVLLRAMPRSLRTPRAEEVLGLAYRALLHASAKRHSEEGRAGAAALQYHKLRQVLPGDISVLYYLAESLLEAGYRDGSAAVYIQAMKQWPRDLRLHNMACSTIGAWCCAQCTGI